MKCWICKDILKEPTTLPCGHNFCSHCITRQKDEMIYEENYSCPKCSMAFDTKAESNTYETMKPVGSKIQCGSTDDNIQTSIIAELKGKLEKPQQPFKYKKIQKAKESLQETLCPHHNKTPQLYCIDDEKCICEECNLSEHRSHDIVPADEERREREKKVEEILWKAKREIQERELILQKISHNFECVKTSSQSALEVNEKQFAGMISSLERMKEDLNKTIEEQKKVLVSEAQSEECQQKRAIMSLQATIADLESLSQIKEDIHYIKKSQSIIRHQEEADAVINHVDDNLSFEFVKIAIKHLKITLEDGCKMAIDSIQNTVRNVQVVKSSEGKQKTTIHPPRHVHRSSTDVTGPRPCIELRPKKRQDFLKHACPLTLDPNTAHPNLSISEDNTKITGCSSKFKKKKLSVQKFDSWEQVLCKEDLRGGRFYWEVEWSGMGAFIGVVRENFPRKGEESECGLGRNPNSWCLQCSNTTHYVWHNDVPIAIPANVFSPRIGLYLDHKAGRLEFYAVSDKMTLLYRFPLEKDSGHLYPAFGLGLGLELQSIIKINKLERSQRSTIV